jgi:hypothetical protein
VQLVLIDGMTYIIVAGTVISTDCTENTVFLLFTNCCVIMADCFDFAILTLSEYATMPRKMRVMFQVKMLKPKAFHEFNLIWKGNKV